MELEKTALLVSDDGSLIHEMRKLLEEQKFVVKEVSSGKDAEETIELYTFTLIICDLQNSDYDGLKFLSFVRKKTPDKFLLIAPLTAPLQNQHAKTLGANSFLTKPFTKHDFSQAVQAAFASNFARPCITAAQDYSPVPLHEVSTGAIASADLYLNLSPKKFIKVSKKGETLEQDRILKYINKGRKWLYMKKADFANHVGFFLENKDPQFFEYKQRYNQKLLHMNHTLDNMVTQLCQVGLTMEQLDHAVNMILSTVDLISSNPSTLKLLGHVDDPESIPSHGISVAIWSCLIAKKVGWTRSALYFQVILAALFHDIGLREVPAEIQSKSVHHLTPQDFRVLESHVFKGRDLLLAIPEIPKEVATVAYQHHEKMQGGGFPENIQEKKIHPLTRLVSVADHMADLMAQVYRGQELNLGTLYEMLMKTAKDFDPSFLEALRLITEEAGQNLNSPWSQSEATEKIS